MKAGWCNTVEKFLQIDEEVITNNLKQNDFEQFSRNSSPQQISAWKNSIKILKNEFKNLANLAKYTIIFEYTLPREGGRRPDVILLSKNHVLIFEFKDYNIVKNSHLDQVSAYSKDIKTYHHLSHSMSVTPILISTGWNGTKHKIDDVNVVNKNEIGSFVNELIRNDESYTNVNDWINSDYLPLPSILQAARMIFQNEELPKIKTAQSAGIPNTISKLLEIAKNARETNSNHLALVTGVPGAGKTLVGLQLVYTLDKFDKEITGVFLSGNGPLVDVLQYTLGKGSKSFVQPVHNFLKEYGGNNISTPHENIWIYDEAQRAWDSERTLKKRGYDNTEPDDFIELGDRINSWCLIVGLIGEGQNIHTGEEGGLKLWSNAIEESKNDWKIFCPKKLESIFPVGLDLEFHDELDLTRTLRSHIAEDVAKWTSKLIDGKISEAKELSIQIIKQGFELYITNDLEVAKTYVKERYDGQDEKRFGLIASSKAKILPKYGIQNDFMTTRRVRFGPWYSDEPSSEKSCCALNSTVTEFGCQGLELDMPIICWGEDLIWENNWKTFSKSRGQKDPHMLRLNSYRVLLSRGRDGIIVFIPDTPELKPTYKILVESGLLELNLTE
tara:strand:+ start:90 stop:1928 length:1839 start_codon:yes stop_codon:yes gene_type:complete